MLWGGNSDVLYTCTIVLLIITLFFSGLRFYVRIKSKGFGADDYVLAIGIAFLLWMVQCNIYGAIHGVGVWDISRIPPMEQIEATKGFTLAQLSFLLSQYFIKISIGITQARIAYGRRGIIWSIYAVSVVFTIMCSIVFVYILARCHPIAASWNPLIPGGSCAKFSILTTISYVNSAVLIAVDWFLAILPVFLLWNVQINRKAKIGACVLLGLGVFASICGIVRLKYTIDLSTSKHPFHDVASIIIWAYVEACIGIIAVSCMCLRPLFMSMLRVLGLSDGSGGQTTGKPTTTGATSMFRSRSRHHRFTDAGSASEGGHGMDFLQKSGTKATFTDVYADPRRTSSGESDSESRKQILGSDIHVLQDVEVSYSRE